jgi:uncharacterized protein (DUF1330 family)
MDGPFTLAFVGYTDGRGEEAAAYEDAVLPLLADHGARVLFRGRRVEGEDAALPFEVHLLWFPNRASYEAYLADERRRALLERFGDVFTRKDAVVVDVIEALS